MVDAAQGSEGRVAEGQQSTTRAGGDDATFVESPAQSGAETSRDDIGYLLGWLCWIPPIALVAAMIFLYKRRWRKAFQATAITVIYVICISVVQITVMSSVKGRSLSQGEYATHRVTSIVSNILTVVAVPLVSVYLLRRSGWPKRREADQQTKA